MSWESGTNMELIYQNVVSATAKASFTSEVQINDVAGMGQQAFIRPNFFNNQPYGLGKTIRIVARGILSSTGTPTYTFTVRVGTAGNTTAAIALGSGALTTGSGVTNKLFELEGDIVLRSFGAAGNNSTIQGMGFISSGGLASPFIYDLFGGAASPGTVATFDPTITNFINFNVTCSASSASNSIQLLQLQLWGMN